MCSDRTSSSVERSVRAMGARREIYVQTFEPGKPASFAHWQISDAGGQMPRWRGDGKEIFYLSLDGKVMAVRVSGNGAAFQSSTPPFLFNATPLQLRTPSLEYDVLMIFEFQVPFVLWSSRYVGSALRKTANVCEYRIRFRTLDT